MVYQCDTRLSRLQGSGSATEFVEERMIDFIRRQGTQAKFQCLQHVDEFLAVDQFNWWTTIVQSFSVRLQTPRFDDSRRASRVR